MAFEPLTILMAEDDEGHASLVKRNLQRCGIANRIVRVADGQQALDYLRCEGDYASRAKNSGLLLLLDINMPLVNGVEVLESVKADPATAHIPIIMLTTTDDPREIRRCYDVGCSVYVTKPLEYNAFVEAIQRLGLFLQVVKVPEEGCDAASQSAIQSHAMARRP
jgi:CheY-like chemotaxis protein